MEEIGLHEYIRLLRRRRWTVFTAAIVTVAIAVIALAVMPRTYQGSATLVFPKPMQETLSTQFAQLVGLPISLATPPGLSGRDIYVSVLKSRTIRENVCKTLDLGRFGVGYEDLEDRLKLETTKEGSLIVSCDVPTSWLKKRVPSARLHEETARLAADITNTFIRELEAYDAAHTLSVAKKNRLYIEKQLRRTREELKTAEDKLVDFQKAHPTLIAPDKASVYASEAHDLLVRQTETDILLNETGGQIHTARAVWRAGGPSDISPEAVMSSPVLSSLREKLAELEVKRATLLENYTEKHPEVVSLGQEIDKVNEEIRKEVDRIVKGMTRSESPAHQELLKQLVLLEINQEGLRARRNAISAALSNVERRLSNLAPMEMEYAGLLRDLKTAETVYTTLLAEHAKARVTEGRETEDFIVLDEATPPKRPIKPRVKLVLAASLVLGLCLGGVLGLLQEGCAASGRRSLDKQTKAVIGEVVRHGQGGEVNGGNKG